MTKGPRRRRRRRPADLPRRSFKRAAADGQDGIHRTGSLRSYVKSRHPALHAASSALSLAQVANVVPITFCPLAPRSVPLTIGRRGAEKCPPLSPLSLSLPTFFAA